MAKNKNFEIKRNAESESTIELKDVPIGNMFERQGSIHMAVNRCGFCTTEGKVTILNINTGNVWETPDNELVSKVRNVQLKYLVDKP